MEKNFSGTETVDTQTAVVEYINFEDLKAFENYFELEKQVAVAIIHVSDPETTWTDVFNSINILRSAIKFNLDILLDKLKPLNPHILRNALSIRSNIAKVALQYFSDLFLFTNKQVLEVALDSIPTLMLIQIQKTKKFIIEQTNTAISNILSSYLTIHVAHALLELMIHKNSTIVQNAHKALDTHMTLHSSYYKGLNDLEIELIIVNILTVFRLKKDPYYKKSIEALKKLVAVAPKNEVLQAIENLNNKSGFEDLNKIVSAAKIEL